jgi:6-phosphogluconolactonase (cycloisomerase 2 family)
MEQTRHPVVGAAVGAHLQFAALVLVTLAALSLFPSDVRAAGLASIGPAFPTGTSPAGIAYSPNGHFLAVANSQDGTVSTFLVRDDGLLVSAGPAVPTGAGATAVAFDPKSKMLAVANRTANTVSAFFVGSTGALTLKGTATVGNGPVALAFTPDGARLAVALHDDSALRMFRIGDGGPVAAAAPLVIPGKPNALAISALGDVAVATDFFPAYYLVYTLDGDGDFNPTPASTRSPVSSDPCAVAFSPDGRWLAESNCYHQQDSISMWSVNADGTLQGGSSVQMPRPASAQSLAFTADGRFLATANAAGNSVSILANNLDGTLTPVNAPAPAGTPSAVSFSPAGFLAVTGSVDNGVSIFKLSDDGDLLPLGGRTSTRPGQASAVSAVFSPGRRFLATATDFFAVGRDGRLRSIGYPTSADLATAPLAFSPDETLLARTIGNQVQLFAIGLDGTLTAVSTTAVDSSPLTDVAFSPDGQYLIAASAIGSVTTFSVALGGALVQTGPGWRADSGTWHGWRFSPDGRLVVAIRTNPDQVMSFEFSASGTLTARSAVTLPAAMGSRTLAFSSDGGLLATADAERGTVTTLVVGSDGSLTLGDTEALGGGGASGAVFMPISNTLLGMTQSGTATLFATTASGALTQPQPSESLDAAPSALALSDDGALLATVNPSDNTITVFALLAPWARPTIATGPSGAVSSTRATVSFTTNYLSTTQCSVDATAYVPCTSPWTASVLADGPHKLTVRAVDLAGNIQRSASRMWTVDSMAPERAALARPLADATGVRADRQTFSWSPVTDDLTGVDHYELWLDDHRVRSVPPPSCGSVCTVTLTDVLAGGAHRWEVRAIDGTGNTSSSAARAFDVDATPPDPPALTSPSEDAVAATSRPDFTWRPATDAGSGLQSYDVQIDDQTLVAALPASAVGWTPPIDLNDGAHSWSVVATDVNGNRQTSAVGRFTIDTTPPVARVVPAPDPALSGRTVTFDASGSQDALGGTIVRYEWDLDGDGIFESSSSTPTATHVYTTTAKLTVPIAVRVTDRTGLTATATRTTRVYPDSTSKPPGFTIDDQAHYTNSDRVALSMLAPSFATDVEVSNDGSFLTSESFKVTPTVPWKLDPAGADREARTVYIRFRRGAIVSDQFTDDIILDTLPPVISQAAIGERKGRPIVQVRARDQGLAGIDGAQVTNDRKHPPDDYADVRFRAQRAEIKLRSRRGRRAREAAGGGIVVDPARPMYMRLRDRAGNITRWKRVGR